jgi:hypothetical protein
VQSKLKCCSACLGTQEALDEMTPVHSLCRIGRPEEIVDAVGWLFSDRPFYYTGQSLMLDTAPVRDATQERERRSTRREAHVPTSLIDEFRLSLSSTS